MKQEKGISLISLVITIVLMIIIAGTVISVSLGNLNTKNLTSMYTDLKSINDKIVIYYNKYGTLPIKEKFMGSYEFTTVANPNDDEEGYYIIDVNKLDKLILSKKISGNGNDVYIVNTQTHMVYYPEGVELDGEMYYRLPGEYSKLELITDLQMELKANTTDLVNAVTISVTGSSESGMKSYVSASGSTKTYTSVTKNIKESYEVKQNGIYEFTLTNNKGETVSKTITISNIDNQAPIVALTPNGGTGYVMPSEGNARIKTKIGVTDAGGSTLKTLQYAWSESKLAEPTNWTNFSNGEEVSKTDITEAGTWYLWTKVIDSAGNRATNIKTSEGFVVSANTEDEYVIKLIPDYTDWTANNITVTATCGSNLTPISTTCTGTSGTDYTVNGTTSVAVKTNNQTVTATAMDKAGNVITATLTVTKIDKNAPIVTANAESVTIFEGESNDVKGYFTYSENGGATITSVIYTDVSNNNAVIENTNTLAIGIHTIRCTVTKETGKSNYAEITIVVESVVDENGLAKKNVTIKPSEDSNVQIVIPKGWAPAILEGSNSVSSLPTDSGKVISIMPYEEWKNITIEQINHGIVIVDHVITYTNNVSDFNEYVWVSMPESTDFASVKWYSSIVLGSSGYWDDTSTEEYTNMVSSVNTNKGFYIGRYEASNAGNNVAQTKRGLSPWHSITMADAMNACKNTSIPNAHILYGIEYDSMLKWFINNAYVYSLSARTNVILNEWNLTTNSADWGLYKGWAGGGMADTGYGNETKVNNIYGLAGNLWELTQEKYASASTNWVLRGGAYHIYGDDWPAAARWTGTAITDQYVGFRVSFYL